jgi:predicted lipoprotein with Yx(FWY)xxD motif
MKSIRTPLAAAAAALAAGALAGGVATAATAATATAARSATVKLASTSLGKILVDGSGFTVYVFSKDGRNQDTCIKVSGCTAVWPPLTTSGRPSAGRGVKSSLLGTISIGHGRKQVTYDGHALYTYTGDSGPAQTDYVGQSASGGVWDAITASGARKG